MTTAPPPGEINGPPEDSRRRFRDAVLQQEHAMTTHFAVIEGWLGMLDDDALDEEQCRRAAAVVKERTQALRLDLGSLLRTVKEWTDQDDVEKR